MERLDVHAQISGPSTFTGPAAIHPCRRSHAGERLAVRRLRPFSGSARYQAVASRRCGDQTRRPRARPDRDLLRPPSAHPEAARDSRTAKEVFRAALETDPRTWPRLPLSRIFRAYPGRRRRLPHRPRNLDLQVQRFSTRVLAGAAEPCAHLARDGVGLRKRLSELRLRPDALSEPWASRFQAAVGGTRGGSLPLGRRGVSPPAPFGRRPARASARSRRSARTALVVPGHRGAPYTSMPPDRAAITGTIRSIDRAPPRQPCEDCHPRRSAT